MNGRPCPHVVAPSDLPSLPSQLISDSPDMTLVLPVLTRPLAADVTTAAAAAAALQDEPGGYKALVFDQGDRVSQSVSAADVADICLRALHESEVRSNSTHVGQDP